jgi:NUMOD4 motif/HNH endonuclease
VRTAPCTRCGDPREVAADQDASKLVCHPCRRRARSAICCDCGYRFTKPPKYQRARRCDSCRADARTEHVTEHQRTEPTEPENWLPAVEYEGLYEVSDHGRVQSLDREATDRNGVTRTVHGRILKATADYDGYPVVMVYREGRLKRVYVHKIELETFIGQRPLGLHARHRNGIRDDNHLSNLCWARKGASRRQLATRAAA